MGALQHAQAGVGGSPVASCLGTTAKDRSPLGCVPFRCREFPYVLLEGRRRPRRPVGSGRCQFRISRLVLSVREPGRGGSAVRAGGGSDGGGAGVDGVSAGWWWRGGSALRRGENPLRFRLPFASSGSTTADRRGEGSPQLHRSVAALPPCLGLYSAPPPLWKTKRYIFVPRPTQLLTARGGGAVKSTNGSGLSWSLW